MSVKVTIKDCIRICTVYFKVIGIRYVTGTFILIYCLII